VILPKAVREAAGIEEGDEVIVEVDDGIILKAVKRKIDPEKLREALARAHAHLLQEASRQNRIYGACVDEEDYLSRVLRVLDIPDFCLDPVEAHSRLANILRPAIKAFPGDAASNYAR
jgi:AbrB family looped-hinge helix DNA binding protein